MTNILYIIADQLRWDALPCNGATFVAAPSFDRLTQWGTNFACAYSGNPVCAPARAMLATGCYSHRCMQPTSEHSSEGPIVLPHIVQHAKAAGYATYGFGKFHHLPYKSNPGFDVFEVAEEGRIGAMRAQGMLPESVTEDYLEYLLAQGFEGYQRAHGIGNNDVRAGRSPLPAEHYVDAWSTTRAIETLREHLRTTPKQPFFLQLGWVKPHAPYDPPAPYDQMYDPRAIPHPWGGPGDMAGRNPLMPKFRLNYLVDRMSEAGVQYTRAHYFGLVSFLDSQLGRLLDFLNEQDLSGDTVVVFTSDHGDNLGDHGVFFKTVLTEGSARVPLIIAAPGQPGGATCTQVVGQEDVVPTICELAGLNAMRDIDGRSVVPLMRSPSMTHKPFVICQHGVGDRMTLMLREHRLKYCFARYGATEELYDLDDDPHELRNLAASAEHRAELRRMRARADAWCRANAHEAICGDDGEPYSVTFNLEDHLVEPSQALGIRPW